MPLTEAQFQQQVTDYADLHGWKWHHVHDSRKSKEGWPDLFMTRGIDAVAWELKVGTNTTTQEQRAWLAALGETGACVAVCRPDSAPKKERWGGLVLTSEGYDFGCIGSILTLGVRR